MDSRIEMLIEVLRAGEWEAGQEAARQLGEIGAEAIEPLIALLREYRTVEDYEAKTNPHSLAEEALIEIGEPAVDSLIAALQDETWGAHAGAVYALGQIGDVRAVQPMIEALGWGDPPGSEIFQVLPEFGDIILRPLIFALENHVNAEVRGGAAYLVSTFEDPVVVPTLIAALEADENEDVRQTAAYALGKKEDARAVEPLIAALEDDAAAVREASARALGEIGAAVGGGRISGALSKALHDSDWGTRQSAAEMLIRLRGEGAQEAETLLMSDLRDDDVEVRLGAAWSFVELGDAQALDPLVRLLYHHENKVASAAAVGLGKLGDERAVIPLTGALDHADEGVREAARDALRRLEST